MSKLAFENPTGKYFHLSQEMIEQGLRASRESSRLRMIFPIHRQQNAEVQRMINFLQPGTYIRPHLHPMPHASESIVVIKGAIRFFTFDDSGNKLSDQLLKSAPIPGVLDIEPGTWHSFVVLEKDTIIFECKKGPYSTETDKKFAEWAPAERDQQAKSWMEKLLL